MERRDFLKMGSAAGVIPALWPAKGFCATGEKAGPWISVGYLSLESERGADAAGGCWTPIPIPITRAGNLSRGDRELVDQGCRLTVQGLFPSPAAAEQKGLLSLSLEVSYKPFQPVSYRAWSYENVFAPNLSHPASFLIPLSREHGLHLSLFLRRVENGTLVETEHAVRLSPGCERGIPKLRPGTYFLGIHENTPTREGHWGRYELTAPDGKGSEEDRWMVFERPLPGFEPRPVGFPYIVMLVGYGGEIAEEIA